MLLEDPVYPRAVVNTLLYLAMGVNLKLFLALMLSGFFVRQEWWVRILLLIFMLPWAVPAIPGYISIHWMLTGQWGLINNVIWELFQVDGPPWLDEANFAFGSIIYAYIWKWTPFWTLISVAGRLPIPIYWIMRCYGLGGTSLAAIMYGLPPLIICYVFRRHMSGGLTMGGREGIGRFGVSGSASRSAARRVSPGRRCASRRRRRRLPGPRYRSC